MQDTAEFRKHVARAENERNSALEQLSKLAKKFATLTPVATVRINRHDVTATLRSLEPTARVELDPPCEQVTLSLYIQGPLDEAIANGLTAKLHDMLSPDRT